MEVSFELDVDELIDLLDVSDIVCSELEDRVPDAVSDEFSEYDVPEWTDIHEAINLGMVEYAEAMQFITAEDLSSFLSEYCTVPQDDLQDEIEGLRDRIEYLEYTRLSARVGRLFTLTSSLLAKVSRRVHWHMPRR